MPLARTRSDRCPGVLRPWRADDGLLVRLRVPGGRVPAPALRALAAVAEECGDGRVRVTSRANLQLRALPGSADRLSPDVLAAVDRTGLVPSRSHELVRNIVVSPQTGLAGGQADLRPLTRLLDEALCARPALARLPGRFLFVLDDGRGDLVRRECDLGLVALDPQLAQLRVGSRWGPVVRLADAPQHLVALAGAFLDRRGEGPAAAWHVDELDQPLVPVALADPRLPVPAGPLPYGAVPGGTHVPVPTDGLDRALVEQICRRTRVPIVTPWHGVLVASEAS